MGYPFWGSRNLPRTEVSTIKMLVLLLHEISFSMDLPCVAPASRAQKAFAIAHPVSSCYGNELATATSYIDM